MDVNENPVQHNIKTNDPNGLDYSPFSATTLLAITEANSTRTKKKNVNRYE